MKSKVCYKCKDNKSLVNFGKNKNQKDGFRMYCKQCVTKYYSKRNSKTDKKWQKNNTEKRKIQKDAYYQNNKEKRLQQNKEWYIINKEHIRKRQKIYDNKRYKNDISHKLSCCISTGIYQSLNGAKNRKKWQTLVGYSLEELKSHLEFLFKPGMSWDNHGLKGWHIDHIKPKSHFHFKSYEDAGFKQCWSLDNLQPLWASDNLSKSNRFVG